MRKEYYSSHNVVKNIIRPQSDAVAEYVRTTGGSPIENQLVRDYASAEHLLWSLLNGIVTLDELWAKMTPDKIMESMG